MPDKISVIPEPVHWRLTGGRFTLSAQSVITAQDAALDKARLLRWTSSSTPNSAPWARKATA